MSLKNKTDLTVEGRVSASTALNIPDWKPVTTYSIDDVVFNNDIIYRCNTAHSSGATFAANAVRFTAQPGGSVLDEDDMVSNDATIAPSQQSTKAYSDAREIDRVVQYTTPLSTTFQAGQLMRRDGNIYECLVNGTPASGGFETELPIPNWKRITGSFSGTFQGNTSSSGASMIIFGNDGSNSSSIAWNDIRNLDYIPEGTVYYCTLGGVGSNFVLNDGDTPGQVNFEVGDVIAKRQNVWVKETPSAGGSNITEAFFSETVTTTIYEDEFLRFIWDSTAGQVFFSLKDPQPSGIFWNLVALTFKVLPTPTFSSTNAETLERVFHGRISAPLNTAKFFSWTGTADANFRMSGLAGKANMTLRVHSDPNINTLLHPTYRLELILNTNTIYATIERLGI